MKIVCVSGSWNDDTSDARPPISIEETKCSKKSVDDHAITQNIIKRTLLSQLGLSLLYGSHDHITYTGGGKTIETSSDSVNGDEVQVLGSTVIRTVHFGSNRKTKSHSVLISTGTTSSSFRHLFNLVCCVLQKNLRFLSYPKPEWPICGLYTVSRGIHDIYVWCSFFFCLSACCSSCCVRVCCVLQKNLRFLTLSLRRRPMANFIGGSCTLRREGFMYSFSLSLFLSLSLSLTLCACCSWMCVSH